MSGAGAGAGATASATVGDACKALLADQVAVERAKKASLEARGLAVITTSGTLVTLLLALAALATKADRYTLPPAPRVLLIAAVAVFLVAAALGIYCNAPVRYLEIAPESLGTLTEAKVWSQPGSEAEREIAQATLGVLAAARDANGRKALALTVAVGAQVVAILLTGVAVTLILL